MSMLVCTTRTCQSCMDWGLNWTLTGRQVGVALVATAHTTGELRRKARQSHQMGKPDKAMTGKSLPCRAWGESVKSERGGMGEGGPWITNLHLRPGLGKSDVVMDGQRVAGLPGFATFFATAHFVRLLMADAGHCWPCCSCLSGVGWAFVSIHTHTGTHTHTHSDIGQGPLS